MWYKRGSVFAEFEGNLPPTMKEACHLVVESETKRSKNIVGLQKEVY